MLNFLERRQKAKFSKVPSRQPGKASESARREGGPVKGKRGKEEREDRPNAVTLITLRLPRELRLCQVAIISYTRWLFLNRPSAPLICKATRAAQSIWNH